MTQGWDWSRGILGTLQVDILNRHHLADALGDIKRGLISTTRRIFWTEAIRVCWQRVAAVNV